jgi:hypothetical protein
MSLALIEHLSGAVAQGVGAPARVTVTGASHLSDYSFYMRGPFPSM